MDSQEKHLHELRIKNISEEKKLESRVAHIEEKEKELDEKIKWYEREKIRIE